MQRFKQDYERDEKLHLQKIADLETEIKRLHLLINESEAIIKTLSEENNRYHQEAGHVQKLKTEYQQYLSEIYWAPKKNERGAGRKSMLTDSAVSTIKQYRAEGKTQKEIAELMGFSIGLVNKACHLFTINIS
jgi:hypothetical protein